MLENCIETRNGQLNSIRVRKKIIDICVFSLFASSKELILPDYEKKQRKWKGDSSNCKKTNKTCMDFAYRRKKV